MYILQSSGRVQVLRGIMVYFDVGWKYKKFNVGKLQIYFSIMVCGVCTRILTDRTQSFACCSEILNQLLIHSN